MKGSVQILFETERLIVRHYTKDDSDNFFSLNGDEEIMRYIRPAKTREETDLFLSEIIKNMKKIHPLDVGQPKINILVCLLVHLLLFR